MAKNVLKIVSDAMSTLGIEYGLVTYDKDPIVYPYFVGQYTEQEPLTEDGLRTGVLKLDGWNRGTLLTLENARERIEQTFDPISGLVATLDDGSVVAIFYAGSLNVPTGDAELKRIQINLSIKEWKVN